MFAQQKIGGTKPPSYLHPALAPSLIGHCYFEQLWKAFNSLIYKIFWLTETGLKLLAVLDLVLPISIFTDSHKSCESYSLITGYKLNIRKMFGRRPGHLLNVLCTFKLRPVSRGYILEKENTRTHNFLILKTLKSLFVINFSHTST